MAAKYRNIQKLRLRIKAVLFYRKKWGKFYNINSAVKRKTLGVLLYEV